MRAYPIPTLASVTVPALLFYVKYASYTSQNLSREVRNRLGILMIVVLVLTYLFIAAGFAPSAYGQSYPVPRARFIGRVLMTAALITEGALLGTLASQSKNNLFQSAALHGFATLALVASYDLPAPNCMADVWRNPCVSGASCGLGLRRV